MTEVSTTRRRGWLSGSLYGIASWIVPVVLSLVVTPQIVHGLGAEQYGLYALVLGFIGYSFNFNLSRAVTRRISEARAAGDESTVPVLVGTGFVLAAVIGLLAVGVIWQVSRFYIGSTLGLGDSAESEMLFSGMVLGASTILWLLLGQVFTAVIQGYERLDIFGWISGITSAGTIAVGLVLVKLGYGFVSLLAATSVITLSMTVVSAIAALRLMGPAGSFRFDGAAAGSIFSHSKYVIGYQVLSNVVLLFERTVIATDLGADSLSYYVVPMMIGIQFVGFVNGLALFVFPAVSARSEADETVVDIYTSVSAVVFVLCSLALVSTLAHAEGFLTLWMGHDFAARATRSFELQMVGLLTVSMATVIFQVSEGMGRPKLNLWATALISSVTVLLMLAQLWGSSIDSYAVARAIGFGLWLPLIPLIEIMVFGAVQLRMWGNIFKSCVPAIVFYAGVQIVVPMVWESGPAAMIAALAIGAVGAGGILFGTGFQGHLKAGFRSNRHGSSNLGS